MTMYIVILGFLGGNGAAVAGLALMTGAGAGLAAEVGFASSGFSWVLAAKEGAGTGFAGPELALTSTGLAPLGSTGFVCGGVTVVPGLAGITEGLGGSTGFDGGVMMTVGLGCMGGVTGLAGTTGFAGS